MAGSTDGGSGQAWPSTHSGSARHSDRSIPRARLETLFTDNRHALRERLLWRLYETAARAEEILPLNVEDLDPEFRRARVVSKGGASE